MKTILSLLDGQARAAEQAQQQQLVDGTAVSQALSVSRRTLDRWVSCGLFPEPIRCGNGPRPRLRWRASDVARFIEEQSQRQ